VIMKINFNNARKQCGMAYNCLVKELNDSIDSDTKRVVVASESIQKALDDLMMSIGSIMATYVEGDDDFKDVLLAHELFEMNNHVHGKLQRHEAHEKAVAETDEYIARYLSEREQVRFRLMLDSLPLRRSEPSRMRVVTHKISF